ncbi:YraN family protein [Pseudothauera rhizosphaerae]|nr:YraN family protein [Pseudothauera rhizosphaerae]
MKRFLAGIRRPILDAAAPAAQARGHAAEELAARFLAAHGMRILARNVRCRGGEIDLVGLVRGTVVFVEVRLRSGSAFGGPAASITAHKRRRVVLAARWWLAGAGRAYADHPCRFDAVLLRDLDPAGVEWIHAAFDAE